MIDEHRVGSWGSSPDGPSDLQDVILNTHGVDKGRVQSRSKSVSKKKRGSSAGKKKKGSSTKLPAVRGSGAAAVKSRRAAAPSVGSRSSKGSKATKRSAKSGRSKASKGGKSVKSKSSKGSKSKKSSVGGKKKKASSAPAGRKKAGSVSTASKKKKGKAASSVGSGTSRRTGSKLNASTSKGKGKGKKGRQSIVAALRTLDEQESELRKVIAADEEMERGNYIPIYNVLVMEIMRSQVETLNQRQKTLNDTMAALREQGLNMGDGEGIEAVLERLRQKLHSEAVEEAIQLRAENMALRDRLEEKGLEYEKKLAEVEVMRHTMARKLARTEVDNENMRAEVHSVLQDATLDVDRMKRELGHRIDIATSALRTPKYGTALRSLHTLAQDYQTEVQEHRDRLSKLILMIGAKDTFIKDPSETMHSNLPSQYRVDLRKLNKDHLLNIMDVLSFQEGVVETVGKALFVISTEEKHKTSVV